MNTSTEETATTSKPPPRFRFTLRTMFVVMAIASVAVMLFVRYVGCIGLIFAILVLEAGWCYLRRDKIRAVGYLAVFLAFWLTMQFVGPYTSLRNRVVWVVGTERLQQWAVDTLDHPPPADENGRIFLDRDALPEDIRSVAGDYNWVTLATDKREACIIFGPGGRFYHWSILVGRPGFVPASPSQYDKIADGIWGYQGD